MESYRHPCAAGQSFNSGFIKKLHLLPDRFDRLLFRLVNEFSPRTISFCGSTFGITLLALALADRRIKLEAQVENSHYRSFCRSLIEAYEVGNIDVTVAGDVTASDFVVVQNPLDPPDCIRILTQILVGPEYHGVVVLCGIHISEEMEAVWEMCKRDQTVRISLDLFEIGILICKKGLQKEDFVLGF